MSKKALAKKQNAVPEEQTKNYQEALQKILQKLNEARVISVKNSWDIGGIVSDILSQTKKYGEKTVEQIAKDINWPKGQTMLYYCMRISEFFTEKMLNQFIDAGGSISHAIKIIEAPEDKMKELYDRFLRENLSVREMESLIKSWKQKALPKTETKADINKVINLCEKVVDALQDIKSQVEQKSINLTEDTAMNLKQLLDVIKETIDWLQKSL